MFHEQLIESCIKALNLTGWYPNQLLFHMESHPTGPMDVTNMQIMQKKGHYFGTVYGKSVTF